MPLLLFTKRIDTPPHLRIAGAMKQINPIAVDGHGKIVDPLQEVSRFIRGKSHGGVDIQRDQVLLQCTLALPDSFEEAPVYEMRERVPRINVGRPMIRHFRIEVIEPVLECDAEFDP